MASYSDSELADVGNANHGAGSSSEDDDLGAVTGYTFTEDQVEYMKDKLESYSNTPPKKRKHFLKRIYDHFRNEINKGDEKPMNRNEETLLFEGIRTWFKSSLKPAKKNKNQYGTTWYPRLVYIKTHPKRVKALATRYVKGDFDVERFLEEYDSDDPQWDVSDEDGEGAPKGKKRGKKGKKGEPGDWFFNHYQDAATDLMARLSEEELSRYEKLAAKWSAQGPPQEIQAKNADKQGSKRGYKFAKDMHRDFNAVTLSFIGWRRENGRPVAILSEFNRAFGRSVDFSVREKKAVDSLFKAFRSYVFEEFDDEEKSDDESDAIAGTRGQKSQLIPMVRNSYGEPFLPDIATRKRGTTRCDWLRIVLRSFFIYHYQIAGNFKSPDDFRFPWTAILEDPRAFISEDVMEDSILELLKEPSDMRVGPMLAIYNYLYDKQKEARTNEDAIDDLTFELKAYIDQEDDIVPRHPRVISMDEDEWGEYNDLEPGLRPRDDKNTVKARPKDRKPSRSGNRRQLARDHEDEDEGSLADSESETHTVPSKASKATADFEGFDDDNSEAERQLLDPMKLEGEESAGWSSWSDSEAESEGERRHDGLSGGKGEAEPQGVEKEMGLEGAHSDEQEENGEEYEEEVDWDPLEDRKERVGSHDGNDSEDYGYEDDVPEDDEEKPEEDAWNDEEEAGNNEVEAEEDVGNDEEEREEGVGNDEEEREEEEEGEKERVSSYVGIRTRNQKARAKLGMEPPPSASQVGRGSRRLLPSIEVDDDDDDGEYEDGQEDVEAEERISSFKGIRTRNQKAHAHLAKVARRESVPATPRSRPGRKVAVPETPRRVLPSRSTGTVPAKHSRQTGKPVTRSRPKRGGEVATPKRSREEGRGDEGGDSKEQGRKRVREPTSHGASPRKRPRKEESAQPKTPQRSKRAASGTPQAGKRQIQLKEPKRR
ncbi:hypothetical protein CC2G_002184 [Coprinopsis cinerea AmutBmut pab1-1]|nr:hypothetical protein CC2G_002184 [Coprinopsis cinerea AmutBmut pab1-1]